MTDLSRILVHFDASARSLARLRVARALASGFDAQVTTMYAVDPLHQLSVFGQWEPMASNLPKLQARDAEHLAAARRQFERERGDGPSPLSWAELGATPVSGAFADQALFADLVVLGQHDARDADSNNVPADLVATTVIGSGKPALVVPFAGDFTSVGREVLIAWKPTRESARAVASALPVLRRAAKVHVATGDENDLKALAAEGGLDLVGFLRGHGIEPNVHLHAVGAEAVGESLLSLVADLGVDLLVMGCYGHSRMREWALGGVTRTVLQSMTVPVWMSH